MTQVRADSFCPVPLPFWVTPLGWAAAVVVVSCLAFFALFKIRMRKIQAQKYAETFHEEHVFELPPEMQDSLIQRFLNLLGISRASKLNLIKNHVSEHRQRASHLAKNARDMSDMFFIANEQSALLDTIGEARQNLSDALHEELERLAFKSSGVLRQCILAKNLDEHTKNLMKTRPTAVEVKEKMRQVESAIDLVEERLEGLKMPPVCVFEASNDKERMKALERERDFYGHHYPHIVHYSTKDGSGSLGLKWVEVNSPVGTEIHNRQLATALKQKTQFTKAEFEHFGVEYLVQDSYILVETEDPDRDTSYTPRATFFKPAVERPISTSRSSMRVRD
jgi:hypothetical protein